MFELDVQLKFWELIFALATAALIVIAALFVLARVRRRRNPVGFYVEAGGVALSLGEERLLEAIARAGEQQRNLAALARALSADEITVYSAARALKQKELIVETLNPDGASPGFELSSAGNAAALARNYIKLL